MKKYKFDKYWYLGFLGFIGIYKLPLPLEYFYGKGSALALIHLLWFLWFIFFIPQKKII